MIFLADKRIVVTGGTGSLGQTLVRRLLTGECGMPRTVTVFSRDEAKQHVMRLAYQNQRTKATDETVYTGAGRLRFVIGDVRDSHSVAAVLRDTDVVFNAAALKQVPACEYAPFEAVQTNVGGPQNIVRAICEMGLDVETVVGVSTDKAVKPVNVMGMTKALQERVFMTANLTCPRTRFICVRYGNVVASRGSVVPLFVDQIQNGNPVTVTSAQMTRFLLTLDQAVDTIFAALEDSRRGETWVPKVKAVNMVELARLLIGGRSNEVVFTGERPGEKTHEILVSEEEAHRTKDRDAYLVICPILPELRNGPVRKPWSGGEYSSADQLMTRGELSDLLQSQGFLQ